MAKEWKHKRYFRVRVEGSLTEFSDVSHAKTLIGFKPVFDTSTPSVVESLTDSNQTLIMTYEFNSEADQNAFESAVVAEAAPFTGTGVEHFKTEWLHPDGSVSSTANIL